MQIGDFSVGAGGMPAGGYNPSFMKTNRSWLYAIVVDNSAEQLASYNIKKILVCKKDTCSDE
jgi:hypothetical protein